MNLDIGNKLIVLEHLILQDVFIVDLRTEDIIKKFFVLSLYTDNRLTHT